MTRSENETQKKAPASKQDSLAVVPYEAKSEWSRVPRFVQYLAGFGAWTLACALFALGAKSDAFAVIAIVDLLALAGFTIYMHANGWDSFAPGVFFGILLTCLVPIAVIVVRSIPYSD